MAQDSNNNCTAKGDAKVVKDAVKKGVKDSSKPVDKPRRVKKKEVAPDYMTRVVVRQLPPTMTEEQFLNDISPLPEYSEFYFVNGDLSLGEFAFSRAYFKFKNFEEMLIFKDKFDDYVFLDSKGNEFPAIVEFAPLQKMPRPSSEAKKTKQDIKMNTIESDPEYIAFVEELKNTNSTSPPPYSADALLEEIENNKLSKDNDSQLTPLLEFIGKKREEKLKMKEDKKRKKDETKKKKAITKEVKAKEQATKQKANNKPPAPVKPPAQEVKYVIKVKSETKVNPQKAADDSAKVKPAAQKPSNTSNLDNKKDKAKPSTEEKSAKQKEPNTKPARIRNKDRPAREIYRPGSKPKTQQQPQQQQQQQPQQHPPSQPPPTASSSAVGTNAGPSESSTAGKAKVAASSDQGEKPVQNTNTTTTTINTTKSSNTQSKPFKKYRVFTRTKN
ncbi:PREDICTED: regulator of nonsense transcripts 3B-like [Rhagoletis zephyria]|uniref:regulator of nonsense transcripts 3B-like n=1 Tax=Rhagoletis zephyria TaxID=28612 RepID=UPI000811A19A|nr:PREDICTED: regulator of nonsense transcripts 3B-like [Rhagoletis zephyria]